ncbi:MULTISPECIES: hypothetical protein [Clostridium]|uniref:hypothetical protein n=1 Tax=Clostridium TaxID=1485 RepID=UPI0008261202|nr:MULTISPECIES: hypothetical protein [Clostridium]PJI07244.1 hypothetical protein CUB90_04905 [Clostridium sp. CT7]
MIIVNCALKQNDVIKVVEDIEVDNDKPFKYVKKQGLKLFFESKLEDTEKACSVIKKSIRDTSFGNSLYFSVTPQ